MPKTGSSRPFGSEGWALWSPASSGGLATGVCVWDQGLGAQAVLSAGAHQ